MRGFVDIHTHILPGVDDGAQTVKDAMAMLRLAWNHGTRGVILTPHYRGRFKKNSPALLQERFSELRAQADWELPGLNLYLGQEIYYEVDAPGDLTAGNLLRLNNSAYALLEFRPNTPRNQIVHGINEVILSGFTPIIAHAERYNDFREDTSLADEALEMGALIQLNADSILGRHGLSVRRCCHRWLKQEKVHFVASDAHDTTHRTPVLRDCFLEIHKKYGQAYAAKLFEENPLAVINNTAI